MDAQNLFLIIGILTAIGTFATINSRFATAYDTEMSLILLVLSVVSFAIAFGYIDISKFVDMYFGRTE